MPDTVLITGATGLLGRALLQAFRARGWHAVGMGLSRAKPPDILKADLTDAAALQQLLDTTNPTAIIHAAAQRAPDAVAADPAAATALNESATRALAAACAARGAVLLYISTDYVFSGAPGAAPYSEGAAPAPTTAYGATKLAGERAVLEGALQGTGLGVVLRVPVLYGPVERPEESAVNVLMEVVRRAAGGGEEAEIVAMDDWAVRYPTHTEDVARVCVDVAARFVDVAQRRRQQPEGTGAQEDSEGKGEGEGAALPRILQFTGEQALTKFEMCRVFAEILGVSLGGRVRANREGNAPGAAVQRPYDCHMSTQALRDMGIDVHAQDFTAWWRWREGAYRH